MMIAEHIPTEYLPILTAASAFLIMVLLIIATAQLLNRRAEKRSLMEKFEQYSDMSEPPDHSTIKRDGGVKKSILNWLGKLGGRLAPDRTMDYSQRRIRFLKAGLRRPNMPAIFWGSKFSLAILLALCFFSVRVTVFNLLNIQATLFICVFTAVIGFYLPDIWLQIRTKRRKNKILEGLPDALDLLVVCVEAGMGLDAAIHRVAEEIRLSNVLLSDELRMVNLELRAGKSRGDALRDLAIRTDLEDVNSLVTLLIQTDKFGTSVAQALRVYSDTFRTKRYQRAEEMAAKLPVKLVVPLILFIFPSLFVAILGPAGIRVFQVFFQR